MKSTGSTTTEQRLRLMVLCCLSLSGLALEPNQISSALPRFNCNRREEHHSPRLTTNATTVVVDAGMNCRVSSWESSALRWWSTDTTTRYPIITAHSSTCTSNTGVWSYGNDTRTVSKQSSNWCSERQFKGSCHDNAQSIRTVLSQSIK